MDFGDRWVPDHSHVFLGAGHEHAERRTWAVIWLAGMMMVLEIAGGWFFGSIALVADGMHMSTHAGALLLAAMAYSYARRHAADPRFTFGTGKLGDLAGFASAIVLAMISLAIGYEAVARFVAPVPIHFAEAIPIACLGLAVNIVSAWLLSGGGHPHHGHHHGHAHDGHEDEKRLETALGTVFLTVFEERHPPVFRIRGDSRDLADAAISVETLRQDGTRQVFALRDKGGFLQSVDEIPEPHAFEAIVHVGGAQHRVLFEEHEHGHNQAGGAAHRDNNMRAAIVHVIADAAVSVLVIIGLLLARSFGWLWMDPVAGMVGAGVIASWSFGLIKDTGAILLDMNPDARVTQRVRQTIEEAGGRLTDLHVWRLGPGHLGAIVTIATEQDHEAAFYKARLAGLPALSHVTIEIKRKRKEGLLF